MPEPAVILYVAAQLPKRSETFVYREFLALRAAGETVFAASVHPPERNLGAAELDALAAEAVGIYGPGPLALAIDALREVFGHPIRATRTLTRAVADVFSASDVRGTGRLKVLVQAIAGLALARRARRLSSRVTHLHAHMAHVPCTIAMYAAHQLGIPFSFTGHAADIFRDRTLLPEKLRRAAFVACISRWHREFYRSLVPRPDAGYPVIRCAVDTKTLLPREGGSTEQPRILGVGRLVPKKGFDLLLEALAIVRARGRMFHAVIAGDGPEAESLHCLRDRLELGDQFELTGAVANTRVLELVRTSTVFVLPCRVDASGDKDGIPVVLMEAMACGVPCISGDLPAIRELIADGVSGRLTPPGDVAALADALDRLLAEPSRRQTLATAARRRIEEEFSAAANTARLQRAFQPTLSA